MKENKFISEKDVQEIVRLHDLTHEGKVLYPHKSILGKEDKKTVTKQCILQDGKLEFYIGSARDVSFNYCSKWTISTLTENVLEDIKDTFRMDAVAHNLHLLKEGTVKKLWREIEESEAKIHKKKNYIDA